MTGNIRLTPYDEQFDEQIDEAFDEAAGEPDYRAYGSRLSSTAMEEYSASDYSASENSMPLFLSGEQEEAPRRRGFGTGGEMYDRPAVWPRYFKAAIFTTLAAAIALAVASMDNPLALFANAKASLPNTSAGQSDAAPPAPAVQAAAIQSTARVPASAPSASVAPTRDEIAAALKVGRQGPAEIPQAPAAAPPPSRRLGADELANLLTRAKALIAVGDISPARLLLERAADAQEASAALLLAQTYDPAVLGRQDMRSITPDPAMARTWYQKAAQLGSPDAQQFVQSQK